MPDQYKEPVKFMDIKRQANKGIVALTPSSLAFMLAPETRGIPDVPAGFDPRRLPFADVPILLRDQRQHSLANPPQNNPFSVFGAESQLRRNRNKQK